MTQESGERNERIIWEPRFLSDDYLPEKVVGREEQKRKLEMCLAPMKDGQSPLNAWLYGPAGSGKTVLARVLAGEACENASARFVFYVNCWERQSLYQAVQAIADSLKVLGADAQDTNVKLDRIRRAIKDRPVVVILDDIDRIAPSERERTIYALLGLGHTGLICISNRKETLASIEERTKSRLSPVAIPFPPYRAQELEQILGDRARDSLNPGASSDTVLKHLARDAGSDARAAIQALRQAAVAAETTGSGKLTAIVVRDAMVCPEETREEEMARQLPYHQRLIHGLARENGPIPTMELRRLYAGHCRSSGVTPVARRTFSKYVKLLGDRGLVPPETQG